MKGVNCSWRMGRHPMKSQPQADIYNSPQESSCQKQVGQYSFSRSVHLFWMMRKCFPVFLRRRGTARDSTGFWRKEFAILILRGAGGLFSIVKKVLTKTFSLFIPLFYQVSFLRCCFWKHFRLAVMCTNLGYSIYVPLGDGQKTQRAFGVILEGKSLILGSHTPFQHSRMDFWHTSYSALPLHVLVPSYKSKLVRGQVRLEVFLLLWLGFRKEFS